MLRLSGLSLTISIESPKADAKLSLFSPAIIPNIIGLQLITFFVFGEAIKGVEFYLLSSIFIFDPNFFNYADNFRLTPFLFLVC